MIILGFWSSLKHFVKAIVRVVVRVVAAVFGLLVGIFDLLLGFLTWPPKKVRLQIFILSNQAGPLSVLQTLHHQSTSPGKPSKIDSM